MEGKLKDPSLSLWHVWGPAGSSYENIFFPSLLLLMVDSLHKNQTQMWLHDNLTFNSKLKQYFKCRSCVYFRQEDRKLAVGLRNFPILKNVGWKIISSLCFTLRTGKFNFVVIGALGEWTVASCNATLTFLIESTYFRRDMYKRLLLCIKGVSKQGWKSSGCE